MVEEFTRPIASQVPVDPAAERHEAKVQAELNTQFLELKRQAQGTFEAIKGRRGASSEEYWREVVAKATLDYESGNFLIGRMGACRQLDLPLVATLLLVRKELLDGIDNPTTGDRMLADSAVMAYRNYLRIQGWIGSLCLLIERELFGQRSLDDVVGALEAAEVNAQAERLEQTLLPLLDRAQRMMIRALDRLDAKRCCKLDTLVSIGKAGQVNFGSNVRNSIKLPKGD